MMGKLWWWGGSLLCGGLILGGLFIYSVVKTGEEVADHQFSIESWNGRIWGKMVEPLIDNKTYIVLLQNNRELRASGGFMGSYVRLRFDKKGLREMVVKDIYEPDGLLPGHVEPPMPIQEAFGQGWWKLRDANWELDFARAAPAIRWFFVEGNEKPVDGLIAVNLGLVERWVGVLGEIKPATLEETINEDNLYSLAQKSSEYNWFPGSQQKRNFLGPLGVALWDVTKHADWWTKLKVARLFWEELERRQVLLWSADEKNQAIIHRFGLGGEVKIVAGDDLVYWVDSNLGANKADCCIERKMKIDYLNKYQNIDLFWRNDNKTDTPDKITSWGGNYLSYVRLAVPSEKEIKRIVVGGLELELDGEVVATPSAVVGGARGEVYRIERIDDYQVVGFWVRVPIQEDMRAEIELESDRTYNKLLVKRQPGVEKISLEVRDDKQLIFEGAIETDKAVLLSD